MRLFATLRARLLATYLGLLIVGFGGLTGLAGNQIAQSAYHDYASGLRVQALLLASSLADSFEEVNEHGLNASQAGMLIQRATQDTAAHVTILDAAGIVRLDGNGASTGQDLSAAPEISGAATGELIYDRRPDQQGRDTIYTAAPMRYDESVVGYIRLGGPAAIPQATVRERLLMLGMSFLGFSVLGILASLWLLSTLTRPLNELRRAALRMASGDLTQRVPDLTQDEIGEVGTAFNQMATQVEAMVSEQQAFASNASHELRTPLTTIRLRTEALQSDRLDESTTNQYITEIDAEAQRMSGLVDDLILLSRLDAQRLAVGEQQVDLARLVNAVQRDLAGLAEHKAITLNLVKNDAKGNASLAPIQANINHVQVVVRNLLENAIKYTPQGGTVTTTLTQIDDVVRLEVADTGQGIAEDDLPHLVQRFYRADKAHSRQTEGIGLGLALVQSVINLYGGRLQIESAGLGQGTTVSVLWPVL